ncbi:hypothetical protein ACIHFD_42840 [Nonomuraea sp. NPDC051941]|uniref:hypothetical protein n=1 Tax=Nonomuraea sp. NPDC051941 TaxID=3364373 RepID=UPI0037C922CB
MSRRSSARWASALLLAVLPGVLFRIDALLPEPEDATGLYGFVTLYSCRIDLSVRYWDSALRDFPLFSYSGAPLIVLGFAGWYASLRKGRDRLVRAAAVVLTVTATLLVAVGSVPPGKVSADSELDCAGFGRGTPEPAVRDAPHASLLPALASLCPSVASRQAAQESQRQEEAAAYVAGKERACARHRTHRPRIKPVRQRRATMFTEFWTIGGWEDGSEGRVPDLVENLVGSEQKEPVVHR